MTTIKKEVSTKEAAKEATTEALAPATLLEHLKSQNVDLSQPKKITEALEPLSFGELSKLVQPVAKSLLSLMIVRQISTQGADFKVGTKEYAVNIHVILERWNSGYVNEAARKASTGAGKSSKSKSSLPFPRAIIHARMMQLRPSGNSEASLNVLRDLELMEEKWDDALFEVFIASEQASLDATGGKVSLPLRAIRELASEARTARVDAQKLETARIARAMNAINLG